MARLPLIPRSQLDLELSQVLETFMRAAPNFNPAVFQTMGHNPKVSNAFYHFYSGVRLKGLLAIRLKELVRLKIAELNECRT